MCPIRTTTRPHFYLTNLIIFFLKLLVPTLHHQPPKRFLPDQPFRRVRPRQQPHRNLQLHITKIRLGRHRARIRNWCRTLRALGRVSCTRREQQQFRLQFYYTGAFERDYRNTDAGSQGTFATSRRARATRNLNEKKCVCVHFLRRLACEKKNLGERCGEKTDWRRNRFP